jgi:hypothetical protein
MTTKHWALAGLACVLALEPALASDNSKSKIDPKLLLSLYKNGFADASYTKPDPNDPNYVDELTAVRDRQEVEVYQAQQALAAAQALLAQTNEYVMEYMKYSQHGLTGKAIPANILLMNLYEIAIKEASASLTVARGLNSEGIATDATVVQAQLAYDGMLGFYSSQISPNVTGDSGADLNAQAVISIIETDKIVLARAQAAVAQTQTLIDAANGASPASPDNQASNSGSPGADVSDDLANMAILSAEGGSDYDAGDADGGGSD